MKSQDAFRLNVRDLTARQGLKVKDLADMVGLSPSYLSLILSGDRANLSDYHKDAIALALGTTVADLYGPAVSGSPVPRQSRASLGAETRTEPTFILRRKRDITPFEDLLRAFNVSDHLLLEAFYRELNSLSDDEVRKMGSMMRNVLVSWQEASKQRETPAGQEVASRAAPTSDSSVIMGPDDRVLLWLILDLFALIGDVPFAFISTATSWPDEKTHRVLEVLLSLGAVQVSSTDRGESGKSQVLLRPSGRVELETASQWIPPGKKREILLSLARGIDRLEDEETQAGGISVREVHAHQLAQLYLEGGDFRRARAWYEQAAAREFSGGMWRVAKDHLLVVSSLDAILNTPAGDRVLAIQMLVTICFNLGETDEALIYQERNLTYWERSGSAADLVRGLLMASSILARRRDWRRAQEYLDRALGMSQGDYSVQARVRIGLAAILSERGHLTRCREEYEHALDLAGRTQEQSLLAQAALGLGRVFLWRQDFQKSAQYLNRALSLSEKREVALEVLARTEMGKLRFQEGSFSLAKEHLDRAVKAASGMKNPESENAAKAWLSRCLGQGGDSADPELKRNLAFAAREFFLGVDEKQGLVSSLIACAEAEAALNRPAEADAMFREAVREARESDNPVLESMACEAYAFYLKDHDDDLAQVMLERSRWARARFR